MISAIVCAAGLSTRMGERNKLLLPIGETTMIGQTVDTLLASRAGEVIVVVGHEKERMKNVLEGCPIKVIENLDYRTGMTSSIQAGVAAASPDTQGYMICLSDMPTLAPNDLDFLIKAFEDTQPTSKIIIPTFQGQRGNPAIFSLSFQSQLLAHKEPNGCKGIVKTHADEIVLVEMPNDHVLVDVDTEEAYGKFMDSKSKFNIDPK